MKRREGREENERETHFGERFFFPIFFIYTRREMNKKKRKKSLRWDKKKKTKKIIINEIQEETVYLSLLHVYNIIYFYHYYTHIENTLLRRKELIRR